MEALTLRRKKGASGTIVNTDNYDIYIDGKPIDANRLLGINIDLKANTQALVTFTYAFKEIEIDSLSIEKEMEEEDDSAFISMWDV